MDCIYILGSRAEVVFSRSYYEGALTCKHHALYLGSVRILWEFIFFKLCSDLLTRAPKACNVAEKLKKYIFDQFDFLGTLEVLP